MLNPGTKLGSFEITAQIGAGGMGEVYRARDSKLGRDVAIKVLPEAFARDAERMTRFQREAKLLAALNHPNIATIHGLEDSGSTHALVMELAEGPTLADRIRQGPIPIDDALPIAKQIADALEYAHEHGIIHRDLKPANVKVAADDTVKILDFGLAKALETEPSAAELANSPTISRMATQAGVLLGTAAYMSPEQAKAKPVDRRADIWAFGCVLYEMLTGKMAFRGETVTDTLAAVIKEEPDWKQLPAATPPHVRVLLRRCVQKDVRQRLQAMGDARIALEEVLSGAPTPSVAAPAWRHALPWAIAATTAVAAVITFWAPWRATTASSVEPVRFQIPLPEKVTLAISGQFALSPDGRLLAFAGLGSDGVQRIWIRALGSLETRPLPGSEGPGPTPFFWSPDSRFIAFSSAGKLRKIAISGGPAETICDVGGIAGGGSWNRDGVIIFGQVPGSLMRVSAAGGVPAPLTTLDRSRGDIVHVLPSFLPDGRHFIYLRRSDITENSGLYVGSLDSKPEEQSSKQLVRTGFAAAYAPFGDGGSGQLLFIRDGALMAQPFDTHKLQLSGEPTTVAEHIGAYIGFGFFSVSANDVMVYRTGDASGNQLTWLDHQGKVLGTAGQPGIHLTLALSPNGTRAAISTIDSLIRDLWLLDFSRGTSTRFTFGPFANQDAVWSSDENHIIFASNRDGKFDLYQKAATGATEEELLLRSDEDKYPSSWSRDGRFLLYTVVALKTKQDVWLLPLKGDRRPIPFLETVFNEENGRFSPDGRWIAYSSDDSGRQEVYVRRFSPDAAAGAQNVGGKWQVSTAGGAEPLWRGDGKELYYVTPDRRVMVVQVTSDFAFQAGVPKVLFQAPLRAVLASYYQTWDATSDGRRFLFLAPATQREPGPFTVVLNWQAALKK